MGSTTFKGQTRKGPVFLVDTTSNVYKQGVAPVVIGSDGQRYQGKLLNRIDEGKGAIEQYVFPGLPPGMSATLDYGGDQQRIDTSGYFTGQGVGHLQAGSAPGGGGGGFNLGGAQRIGPYGVAPQDLTSQFPKPQTTFTDPIEFSANFGKVQLARLMGTNLFAKNLALDNLDTELQGLKSYVPAAASLKRGQTALDNAFNQGQRTQQVDSVLGDVKKGLVTQTADAEAYSQGRVPDAVLDRSLELSSRAAAADTAAASGFGTQSSAARAASDLMSAKERIGLSQYGNSLKEANSQARQELELAPTEYANVGNEISAVPSISASQLQQSIWGQANQAALISPETALNSTIQQNQWNTQVLNDFAMSLFNYKVGLSNAVASAGQTSINTGIGIDQQNAARDEASKQKNKTQKANTVQSIIGSAGSIIGSVAGFFGF